MTFLLHDVASQNLYSDLMTTTESTTTTEKKTVASDESKKSVSYLYIQMEYCKNGTLEDLINKGDVLLK